MERATELFTKYMHKEHQIEIDTSEIVWEAVTMYHGELDYELFPIEDNLPDPLLFLTASYVDNEEQEWIFCIVADESNSNIWYTAVCLLEGKLLDFNISLELN